MNEILHAFDLELFFLVNDKLSNPFFDTIMPVLRNQNTWIPMYVIILVFFILRYKKALKVLVVVAGLLATFALTDRTAAGVIKPLVKRVRPCNNPDMKEYVHLRLEACGQGYSFVSAHAANHTGIAVFMILLLGIRRWRYILAWLSWPLVIAFAQVYVGVHYPTDIAGGMVTGALIALITFRFTRTLLGKVDHFYRVPAKN